MPFQEYSPEQAALLPLHVRDVLSEEHLVFLVSAVVDKQDLREWEAAYSEEGQRPYHPALLLKVLLYGFALGVRASRKIEQRIKEDLGFRYLAGGAEPDHKTICEFLRRHGRRINDLFMAVLEQLQAAGLVKLGVLALDSTRVKANASRDRVMSEAGLRAERARKRRQVRKWQRELATMDCDENPGGTVVEMHAVQQRLAEIPGELQKLRKSGQKRLSRTDADSRFLHSRDGFVLGYPAEAAVREDGLIVAARVTQAANDHASLVPLVDQTEQRCGQRPQKVLADAGFYFEPECASDGTARSGVIRPGFGAGTRNETKPSGARCDAHFLSWIETDAAAAAVPGWTQAVRTKKGPDRTSVRHAERASRDAQVLPPGLNERDCGVPVDGLSFQLDPSARPARLRARQRGAATVVATETQVYWSTQSAADPVATQTL